MVNDTGPDSGKDWRQEEKGVTEDEMIVWHHWLNGHEFEQAPGDGEGQGSLASYSWGHKESDMTEQLNNNKNDITKTSWIPLFHQERSFREVCIAFHWLGIGWTVTPKWMQYNNSYKKQWRIWRLQFKSSVWTYKSKCWLFPSGFTGGPWMLLNLGLWNCGNLWDQAPWRLAQSPLEHSTCICVSFPGDTLMEWRGQARWIFPVSSPSNQQQYYSSWQGEDLGAKEESEYEGWGSKESEAYPLSHVEDAGRGHWMSVKAGSG